MGKSKSEGKWQIRFVRPGLPGIDRLPELGLPDLSRLPWVNRPIRPADIGGELREAMLTRDNMLEDVNYQKVVPNRYVVEVSETNFAYQFHPIEGQVLRQWRDRLLEELVTANSRHGRKEFHFAGKLQLEVRPAADLKDNEARILSRIEPDAAPGVDQIQRKGQAGSPPVRPGPNVIPPAGARHHTIPPLRNDSPPTTIPDHPRVKPSGKLPLSGSDQQRNLATAVLELAPNGERWALYPGINTIGRSDACQVYLDIPVVQEKRLVSGQHAYIVMQNNACMLYDGSPDGRPSANGTFVNLQRVSPAGYRLQNGDAIILAAVDPLHPRSDTPGVVTFYFWVNL